jgi:hypothetical protein
MKRLNRGSDIAAKGMVAFGVVWLLWAAVYLAGMVGLVYVAWHFISKFW